MRGYKTVYIVKKSVHVPKLIEDVLEVPVEFLEAVMEQGAGGRFV